VTREAITNVIEYRSTGSQANTEGFFNRQMRHPVLPDCPLKKASHDLFPLGRRPKKTRLLGVTNRRILRRQAFSTAW
jgi:hypothetical protein